MNMDMDTTSLTSDDVSSGADSGRDCFPLMKLPVELRLLIIDGLIGCRTLHAVCVSAPEGPDASDESPKDYRHALRFTVCQATVSDVDSATLAQIPLPEKTDVLKDTYSKRHTKCCYDLRRVQYPRENLNVLAVCKEIHEEAALIPFKTNTFIFARPLALKLFLKSLTTKQRDGLHKLQLTATNHHSDWSTPLPTSVVKRMPRDYALTMYIEICLAGFLRGPPNVQELVRGLTGLRQCTRGSIEVCVDRALTSVYTEEFREGTAPSKLAEWAEQVEIMLRKG
ncbi:hypothetical protein LTR15_003044 [Elasticomyces elasticus]|nr:hypothetical protein LTR15_003044 [Elasticomyces elasticus]